MDAERIRSLREAWHMQEVGQEEPKCVTINPQIGYELLDAAETLAALEWASKRYFEGKCDPNCPFYPTEKCDDECDKVWKYRDIFLDAYRKEHPSE